MLLSLPTYLFSQGKITGKVTDGKLPLQGVSVSILKKDSAYITGAITDSSGTYSFRDIKDDSVLVFFSLIGYANKMNALKVPVGALILPDIILESKALTMNAVTINGKRAAFKIEPGIITVDLSAASLGSDGSVLHTLSKIPGVLILNDGTVLLNGQTGANVMIDGKPTYLTGANLVNLLRSIPTNAVDKISLISQPSAAYDAAGSSGIINIQRKRKSNSGLQLNISSNIEAGVYTRQNQSVSARFQHGKASFYTDYSFYTGTDFMFITSSRDYAEMNLRLDMQANRQFISRSHYFKSGIDYDFSDRLSANAYVYTNWFQRSKDELALSDFYYGSPASDSTLSTINHQPTRQSNISGGAGLLYKFNPKLKWDNTFNFLVFKQDEASNQRSDMHVPTGHTTSGALQGVMGNDIHIYTFKSDINHIVSDNLTLQSGIKSTTINIRSSALYNTLQSGNWLEDEALSSGFNYQENVHAAYIQTSKKWNTRFSTEAGLRFEYTNTVAENTSGKLDSIFHRRYAQLFPGFSTRYQLNNDHVLALQYNRRIVRPNYRDLNPFTEVNDRYLQERGNTRLQPALINNMELSWLWRSQYLFSMFYTLRNNPITKSYLTQTGSQATIVMPLNLRRSHAIGLKASLNNLQPTSWWTAHLNGSLTYNTFSWLEFNTIYTNYLLSPTAQVSNQFTLPQQWMIEATGYYSGKMAEGQAIIGDMGSLSLGLRKNLLENKLSIYLYANDIFLTNRPRINLTNSVISGTYRERRDSRMAGITISWHFNAGNVTHKTGKQPNMEESKRIN